MTPGADSAGVPWEGRAFHANPAAGDDGSASPRLIEAIRRFRARELELPDVVRALREARLLVPLLAERGDEGIGPHGQRVDKTQELALVTVEGPDGRRTLPAFSSVEAMRAWNPVARPIPIEAPRIALALAAEETPLLVVDPGSATQLMLRRPAFEMLATGAAWTPAWDDDAVLAAFLEGAAGADAPRALALAPGDPDALGAGPEVVVVLDLAPGLTRESLSALLARLGEAWSAHPVIADRVDSLTIKLAV